MIKAQNPLPPKIELAASSDRIYFVASAGEDEMVINDSIAIGFDTTSINPSHWQAIGALDTVGKYLWHQMIYRPSSAISLRADITVDNNENIYVGSHLQSGWVSHAYLDTNILNENMYIIKFKKDGSILNIIEPTSSNSIRFRDIRLITDVNNNLYVTGTFQNGTFTFGNSTPITSLGVYETNSFVAKFDSLGAPLWLKKAKNSYVMIDDIIVKPDGISYVIGKYHERSELSIDNLSIPGDSTRNYSSTFLCKLNANGTPLFIKDALGSISGVNIFDRYSGIRLLNDGYVIAGSFDGKANFGDGIVHSVVDDALFLVKYDFNDNVVWKKITSSVYTSSITTLNLEVNDNGDIFWYVYTSSNNSILLDGYLVQGRVLFQINSQGIIRCTRNANTNILPSLAVTNEHQYEINTIRYLSPNFSRLYKYNNDSCSLVWQDDWAHNLYSPTHNQEFSEEISLKLFPNPADEQIFVESTVVENKPSTYQIIHVNGQVIQTGTVRLDKSTAIPIGQLGSGMYFLRIFNENKATTLKFIKR